MIPSTDFSGSAGAQRTDHAVPGSDRPLSIFTVHGARPGPTLALIGAVHGDEYEGPLALSALLATIQPEAMAGTLIVCPVANPEAVASFTRCALVDGKNLARCFPGSAEGSYTEQLAVVLTEHVIGPADYLIDLHSGGVALDSVCFAGYSDTPGLGKTARDMAEAMGAPVVWRHEPPVAPGRTLSVAEARGIPAIYVEAGGGPFPPDEIVALYRDGVMRVIHRLGMLPHSAPGRTGEPLRVVGAGDLDVAGPSPVTGLCTCHVALLQPVVPETLCFTISDLDGTVKAEVRAGAAGLPMFLRRNRWVERGELLMALAVTDEG